MALSDDPRIEDMNNTFLNFMKSPPEEVEKAIEEIYDELIDEVLMGFVFDVHRSVKWGSAAAQEGIVNPNAFRIIDEPGHDIFGQSLICSKVAKCKCPKCQYTVSATRFAPHLEKCLGMGRKSARTASQRASSSRSDNTINKDQAGASTSFGSSFGSISDEDNKDDDAAGSKKRKRKKDNKKLKKSSSRDDDRDDNST